MFSASSLFETHNLRPFDPSDSFPSKGLGHRLLFSSPSSPIMKFHEPEPLFQPVEMFSPPSWKQSWLPEYKIPTSSMENNIHAPAPPISKRTHSRWGSEPFQFVESIAGFSNKCSDSAVQWRSNTGERDWGGPVSAKFGLQGSVGANVVDRVFKFQPSALARAELALTCPAGDLEIAPRLQIFYDRSTEFDFQGSEVNLSNLGNKPVSIRLKKDWVSVGVDLHPRHKLDVHFPGWATDELSFAYSGDLLGKQVHASIGFRKFSSGCHWNERHSTRFNAQLQRVHNHSVGEWRTDCRGCQRMVGISSELNLDISHTVALKNVTITTGTGGVVFPERDRRDIHLVMNASGRTQDGAEFWVNGGARKQNDNWFSFLGAGLRKAFDWG